MDNLSLTTAKPVIPDTLLEKWQHIVNLMARIVGVPTGVITRAYATQIEVLVTSQTEGNPYHAGARVSIDAGHYCETVIKQRRTLLVENAFTNPNWGTNPEIAYGMVSYLGYPVTWPDASVFGTICVLDNQTNTYSTDYRQLLEQFRSIVETDLRQLTELELRDQFERQLQAEVARQTAEIRQQQQQLEQLDCMKTRFMQTVSHGLKTPLCSSILYLDLLQRGGDKQDHYLDKLNGEFTKFRAMVEKVLDVTRFTAANAIAPTQQLPVSQLFDQVVDQFETAASEHNITLQAAPIPEDLPPICGDPAALSRALAELVENALLFGCEAGGTVRLTARSLHDDQSGCRIAIDVQDSGNSAYTADLPQVIAAFERGPAGETGHLPGLGLGLAIVQIILEQHHGQLVISGNSDDQRGATFTMLLP